MVATLKKISGNIFVTKLKRQNVSMCQKIERLKFIEVTLEGGPGGERDWWLNGGKIVISCNAAPTLPHRATLVQYKNAM